MAPEHSTRGAAGAGASDDDKSLCRRGLHPTDHLDRAKGRQGMTALLIPKPQVLDPNRLLRDDRERQFSKDHRTRAEVLEIALHESCAYAQQLWDDLNAMRQYLLDSLPPDPHITAGPIAIAAAPTGPDDEQGWQDWITAFAAVTSALCGPNGDSGFGLSRAREEAQRRRTSIVRSQTA